MSNPPETPAQDYEALLDECLAYAVAEGDIVNFRLLFMPASPFRKDSPEDASTPKYDYLFPETTDTPRYREALSLIQQEDISRFIREQLDRKGPPKLPWQAVLALGDNAARLGKYTAAAQAYELLRVRRRIQDIVLDKADERLNRGEIAAAVRGYTIALGLQYDYAAFPEPLPAVPDYQERAPALHSVYPASTEQTLSLQEDAVLCKAALNYLLPYAEFSGRLEQAAPETRIQFTAALIRGLDHDWAAFAEVFRKAAQLTANYQPVFDKLNAFRPDIIEVLAEPPLDPAILPELRTIPQMLSRASAANHEWWHYIKTMAYHHPGAALFVSRQRLSATEEIVVPRIRPDSALAKALELAG